MAGSYSHVAGRGGGWSLIEHMGDAYEMTEELLWLIRRTMAREEAIMLLKAEYYPMARGEKPPDAAFKWVGERMER